MVLRPLGGLKGPLYPYVLLIAPYQSLVVSNVYVWLPAVNEATPTDPLADSYVSYMSVCSATYTVPEGKDTEALAGPEPKDSPEAPYAFQVPDPLMPEVLT